MDETDLTKMSTFCDVAMLAAHHDCRDSIFWATDLTVYVNVSDLFWWACGDMEEIEEDDVDSLRRAIDDVTAVSEHADVGDAFVLFVCRKRNMRPQGAFYKYLTINAYDADGKAEWTWNEDRFNNATKQNGVRELKIDDAKTAALRALFNAMPEREIDMGNPYSTGNEYLFRSPKEQDSEISTQDHANRVDTLAASFTVIDANK